MRVNGAGPVRDVRRHFAHPKIVIIAVEMAGKNDPRVAERNAAQVAKSRPYFEFVTLAQNSGRDAVERAWFSPRFPVQMKWWSLRQMAS
jgi:hypothetical protein